MTLTLSDLDPDFDIAVAANAKETVFALPFFSCQNITEINQNDMHEFNPMKILTDFCEGSLTGKLEPEGFGIHHASNKTIIHSRTTFGRMFGRTGFGFAIDLVATLMAGILPVGVAVRMSSV